MWDSRTVTTSTVDSKKWIVLPGGRPGDVFDIQQQGEGRFLLVRLEKPERTERLSKDGCMEAMRNAPLRPTMAWEQIRKLTREPCLLDTNVLIYAFDIDSSLLPMGERHYRRGRVLLDAGHQITLFAAGTMGVRPRLSRRILRAAARLAGRQPLGAFRRRGSGCRHGMPTYAVCSAAEHSDIVASFTAPEN
jgi:hypothetical protein